MISKSAEQSSGVSPSEAPPAEKKTLAELQTEREVEKAKSSLVLLKVVAIEKVVMPSPFAGWSLAVGANHFEGKVPDAVSDRLKVLQSKQVVTVETLDGDGKSTPWPAEFEKH